MGMGFGPKPLDDFSSHAGTAAGHQDWGEINVKTGPPTSPPLKEAWQEGISFLCMEMR